MSIISSLLCCLGKRSQSPEPYTEKAEWYDVYTLEHSLTKISQLVESSVKDLTALEALKEPRVPALITLDINVSFSLKDSGSSEMKSYEPSYALLPGAVNIDDADYTARG